MQVVGVVHLPHRVIHHRLPLGFMQTLAAPTGMSSASVTSGIRCGAAIPDDS